MNLTLLASNTSNTVESSCDSYLWNGQEYTSSGVYNYVTQNVDGCDSTAILDLTIYPTTYGIDSQIHCDEYTWIDGVTYTADNNTATYILSNNNDCDSIITLDLTINFSDLITESSVACDTYLWNGQEYLSSGNYNYVTQNTAGCDSIVILDLIINPSYSLVDSVFLCEGEVYNIGNNSYCLLYTSPSPRD